MDKRELKLIAEVIGRKLGIAVSNKSTDAERVIVRLTYDLCDIINFPADFTHDDWHDAIDKVKTEYLDH